MQWDDIWLAGVGSRIGTMWSAEDAVASGHYPAEEAERSGVAGVSVLGEHSADAAVTAAVRAVANSGFPVGAVKRIIHGEVLADDAPDMWSPANYIAARLGVEPNCLATDVRQGCNGLGLLELAVPHLVMGGPGAVLLTGAEKWERKVSRWNSSRGFVFGDGAGAAVFSRDGGWARLASLVTESAPKLEVVSRGEGLGPSAYPINMDAVQEQSRRVIPGKEQATIKDAALRRVIGGALRDAGRVIDDVWRVVTPHLTRWLTVDEVCQAAGVPIENTTWEVGSKIGHTGTSDVWIGLEALWRSGRANSGDAILGVTYGGGFTFTAAVFIVS